MADDDARRQHPEFAPTDPPTRGKKMQGVVIPPLRKPPPEPEPEEPPMPPKPEPIHVERGETQGTHHDPWVQRIIAATGLVAALSAAGWGGLKISERDVISGTQAKKLNHALTSCEAAVVKMTNKAEANEKREKLQERQILLHAHVIHRLNGHVSPVYAWPEPRASEWTAGVDNFHHHNRRGGQYPGTEDTD